MSSKAKWGTLSKKLRKAQWPLVTNIELWFSNTSFLKFTKTILMPMLYAAALDALPPTSIGNS
jgi:hypothetical protein